MIKLNRTSIKIENGARRFLSQVAKGDAYLPIIMLEAFVTGGRTYQAYERGGFVEARERGTEETLGAIFWLGGVQAFNKIGDLIGKHILGLENIENDFVNKKKKSRFGLEKIDFEVGKDAVRNPLENYISSVEKQAKKLKTQSKRIPKLSNQTLAVFKFTKIISSILLANSIIGFVVPKLNQAITRNYRSEIEKLDNKNNDGSQTSVKNSYVKTKYGNFDDFIDKTSDKNKNSIAFKGFNVQALLSLTNKFENDATYKLLSTDAGVAGGRAISARNKHERREVLFRDLSSIYFYMYCKNHLNSMFNYIESGRGTRLDPVRTNLLDRHIRKNLKAQSYSPDEFRELVLGRSVEIPENIKAKFGESEVISLSEFKQLIGNNKTLSKIAEQMSKVQPEKVGMGRVLTLEQIQDVYSGGLINNPRFLNFIFNEYSEGKSTNPFKYFADKDLRSLKSKMQNYVEDIIQKASSKGERITVETLKKANRKNLILNGINLGIGFAVCAYCLSTVIPKMQYWITKKSTGEDKFPGIETYKK